MILPWYLVAVLTCFKSCAHTYMYMYSDSQLIVFFSAPGRHSSEWRDAVQVVSWSTREVKGMRPGEACSQEVSRMALCVLRPLHSFNKINSTDSNESTHSTLSKSMSCSRAVPRGPPGGRGPGGGAPACMQARAPIFGMRHAMLFALRARALACSHGSSR